MKQAWIALAAAAALAALPCAHAWGALAIGITETPGDGYAIGNVIGEPTEQAASDKALALCKAQADHPKAAATCVPYETYENACMAVVYDKGLKSDTLGISSGEVATDAEAEAMEGCEVKADDRADHCEIILSVCDPPK